MAEQGVSTKDIATAIGQVLNVPTISISAQKAASHFGWFTDFAMIDTIASSALTQSRLSWKPAHRGLIADLAAAT